MHPADAFCFRQLLSTFDLWLYLTKLNSADAGIYKQLSVTKVDWPILLGSGGLICVAPNELLLFPHKGYSHCCSHLVFPLYAAFMRSWEIEFHGKFFLYPGIFSVNNEGDPGWELEQHNIWVISCSQKKNPGHSSIQTIIPRPFRNIESNLSSSEENW